MKIWGISNPVEHDAGVVQDRTTNEDITARKKTSSLARELIEEILNSPQAEDNRDDPAERAGKTNKKKKRKKKSHKITVGRNNDSDNNNADREQSATSESRSKMLTRLLFSKQNMEQHDQMKVVYRHFGPYAEAVLAIVQEEGMPSPDTAGHVVVKVQVRKTTSPSHR